MSKRPDARSVRELPLILYARVSTVEQAEDGVSLAAQVERLEGYCRSVPLPVLRVAVERGVSGSVHPSKRHEMSKALDDVHAGRAGGLVVVKLDRLSRRLRDTLDLLDDAAKGGWRLVSLSESLDSGTAVGRMFVHMVAALSEMERGVISERTQAGMDQLCREGKRRSGRPPFGYAVDGKSLVEDTAEQVRLQAMLVLRSSRSPARIAKDMNAKGMLNPRTKAPWSPGTVAAILRTHDRRKAIVG